MSKTVGTVEILRPTSFEVRGGSATALVGPNGSGKTTLLRMVLGRDDPTTGTVWLSDEARASEPGIASLTDAAPLYRDLTVRGIFNSSRRAGVARREPAISCR
ncbi:hypothetical protein AX769_01140 [Frondihabitans sp. PAMC 28766]|nr:hypothetical protein AX769_01140 [Frondihabitans sp. PAMC 28766]